jgi:type I restriction enzyme R subunit
MGRPLRKPCLLGSRRTTRPLWMVALAGFLQGRNPNANRTEFINLNIDHLTENEAMEPKRLHEPPFTDLDDQGACGLFPQADVLQIVSVLNDVKLKAAA